MLKPNQQIGTSLGPLRDFVKIRFVESDYFPFHTSVPKGQWIRKISIYLLIRLWNLYSTKYEERDVEPDYAEFGLFLRSVNYDPEPVFGVKR